MALPVISSDEVRAAQRGDRQAFEALVGRAYSSIARFLIGRVYNREVAEDLAQETFVVVARRLSSLRDPERFWAWVFGIARLQVSGFIRRRRRRGTPGSAALLQSVPAPGGEPSAPLERAEQTHLVHEVLAALPAKYAEVLRLRHFAELSYEEIATVLGVPVKTVDTRLRRGAERFRRGFGGAQGSGRATAERPAR